MDTGRVQSLMNDHPGTAFFWEHFFFETFPFMFPWKWTHDPRAMTNLSWDLICLIISMVLKG